MRAARLLCASEQPAAAWKLLSHARRTAAFGPAASSAAAFAAAVGGPRAAAAAACASRAARSSRRRIAAMAQQQQQQQMPGGRGAFILFEGVDRCGKSTQSARLAEALRRRDVPVASWNFPDRQGTATGHAINAYLVGGRDHDDAAIHLLFSANRWEKRAALLRALRGGTTLVVDRYAFSGVAYTAAKEAPGLDASWCKAPDRGLPAPDLVVFLRASSELTAARAGFGGERYEKAAFQDKVRDAFERLRDPSWLVIDAALPVDQIHEQVLTEALGAIKRCQEGQPLRQLWDNGPYQGAEPHEEAAPPEHKQ